MENDSGHLKSWSRQAKLAKIRCDYLSDLPKQVDVFLPLLQNADFDAIQKHAHRIKGTSGTYHFAEIAAVMQTIEKLAIQQDAEAIGAKLECLDGVIECQADEARKQYELWVETHSEEVTHD